MPRTLLILQDDLFFSSMVQAHARRLGIPMEMVTPATIEARAAGRDAVVIMQLTLHPERQLTLLRELRQASPTLPVVAVSGHLETALRRRARDLGARLASNSGLDRALLRAFDLPATR
jgi:DNA-binding NarL/FixJ family response regulator